jgi:hypothetical protein
MTNIQSLMGKLCGPLIAVIGRVKQAMTKTKLPARTAGSDAPFMDASLSTV